MQLPCWAPQAMTPRFLSPTPLQLNLLPALCNSFSHLPSIRSIQLLPFHSASHNSSCLMSLCVIVIPLFPYPLDYSSSRFPPVSSLAIAAILISVRAEEGVLLFVMLLCVLWELPSPRSPCSKPHRLGGNSASIIPLPGRSIAADSCGRGLPGRNSSAPRLATSVPRTRPHFDRLFVVLI